MSKRIKNTDKRPQNVKVEVEDRKRARWGRGTTEHLDQGAPVKSGWLQKAVRWST